MVDDSATIRCAFIDSSGRFAAASGRRFVNGKTFENKLTKINSDGLSFKIISIWLQVGRENNLERSLFTRLQEVCTHVNNKPNIYSLCQQYRMHPEICRWSNQYFYHNRLTSAPCTIDPSFQLNPYGVFSLDFLQSCKNGSSFHNSDEAKFIIDLLKIVVRYADPKRYSYGIITPYSTQRRELQTHIK